MINPRVFADFVGAERSWDAGSNTFTFTGYTLLGVETTVVMTLNSATIQVNGEAHDIATLSGQPQLAGRVMPVVINDRSYVPARVLANIFGVPISFSSGTVTLG